MEPFKTNVPNVTQDSNYSSTDNDDDESPSSQNFTQEETLSNKSLKLMDNLLKDAGTVKVFKIIQIIKVLPFEFNEFEFKLIPISLSSSPKIYWKLYLYYIFALNVLLRFLLMVLFLPRILDPFVPLSQKGIHLAFLITYGIAGTLVINTIVYKDEVAHLFNNTANYKRCGQETKDISTFIFKKLIAFSFYSGLCICIIVTSGIFIQFRQSPFYIMLYNMTYLNIFFAIFIFIYNAYSEFALWFHAMSYFILFLTYISITKTWLVKLRLESQLISKTNNCEQNSKRIQERNLFIWKNFKSLQLLNKQFTKCFSPILIPATQAVLILLAVVCNFCLFRLHNQLNIIMITTFTLSSILSLLMVYLVIPQAASIFTISSSIIKLRKKYYDVPNGTSLSSCIGNNVRSNITRNNSINSSKSVLHIHNKLYWFKCWSASTPMKIKVGFLFYYTKYSTLKIYGLTFYWTLKALLLIKKFKSYEDKA